MQGKKSDRYFQLVLVALILLLNVAVLFAHQNIVLDWFNTDDAFYYFKVAQNIVEGQGVTFDGIARTNGFHPLWLVVLLPIFVIARFDLIIPLRLVIALQLSLGIGAALILYRFCREVCSRWIAFLIALAWSFLPIVFEITFKGGTEAGINAFFLILLWSRLYKVSEQLAVGKFDRRQMLALGGFATLALLSRLDNVFLVFIAGGWLILRFWRPPGADSVSWRATLGWWLKMGISYFAPLVITLGTYLLANQFYFGSFMPVSGKIKRWWGTLKYTAYGNPPGDIREVFNEIFSPQSTIGPWALITAPISKFFAWIIAHLSGVAQVLSLLTVVILLGLLIYAIVQQRKFLVDTFWKWNLIPLLVGCLIQVIYYKAFGHVAQKGWYWIAESFFLILFLALVGEGINRQLVKLRCGKYLVPIAVSVLALFLILTPIKRTQAILAYSPAQEEQFYLLRAHWLEDNTEPGALIGMTGSGTSGYFVRDRVIVNLDGLINSGEYFIHMQKDTADEYLASIGLDYVFGNAYILERTNPYQWFFRGRIAPYRQLELDDKTFTLFRFE
jgi:hypothetical protein